MSGAFTNPVAELRHELRTPVNHIVGYAEMLLEDAEGEGMAERRAALERTIAAAREVLSHIGSVLPATRSDIGEAELTSLFDTLREPQGRILGAMRELLQGVEATADPAFQDDVRRIMNAAERLASPPTVDKPNAEPVPAEAAGAASAPAPARILVVDDVEDNREVLRRRLERQGYEVTCAPDGSTALAMLRETRFDLMLLDVLMPELDGYEVLERAKADPKTSNVPVIMISALDDVTSVVRCIERGADDYLPKPFDPILLKARVSSSLERKRYMDRVALITEAASAVEAGTYRSAMLEDISHIDDPLGRLARVFDRVIREVRAREERLRNRIRDLRSEIEEASSTGEFTAPVVEDASIQSGELVGGRYQVLSVIGAGGMGSVYHARDLELEDDVALKMLLPALMTDGTLVERFKQEIRLARRITHPNVVRTHDLGEWEGIYFLTMELVEGMTVRDLIDSRGQLGVSATLAIGTQLAEALGVAHAQGVVHRDIKPQNLLLDQEGVLKVMDFGVARLVERKSTLTVAGLVVGTPAYMAPEQLLAEAVDARSDLYAAGVVLYECLTGQLPFDADSPISLIAKLLHEDADPPTKINRDIPAPLSELVLSLLAKKPDDRVQSAADMGRRLKEVE